MNLRDELVGEIVEVTSRLAVPAPVISDVDVALIKTQLIPGDIIFCRRDYEISNVGEKVLTDSFWGHCAIFMGNDRILPVYEAVTTDGFRRVSVDRICFTKDAIGIGRVGKFSSEQIDAMEQQAIKWLGLPYNFEMDWSITDKLYCSQAVVKLLQIANPSDVFKETNLIGMEISPQNVWDSVQQIATYGVKS